MEREVLFHPIAVVETDFKEKFGIPRQSGRVKEAVGRIVFLPEYRSPDAVRELSGFSHIWLLFDFSLAHREGFTPTVRPPRLGGNRHVGVFASRSPFRPNPIGLSSVRLLSVREEGELGPVLYVSGVDLLDGTPLFDIKPYLPFSDAHPDATAGYAEAGEGHRLTVTLGEGATPPLEGDRLAALLASLAEDPRPSYQDDPERIYRMRYANCEVLFTVCEKTLTVVGFE